MKPASGAGVAFDHDARCFRAVYPPDRRPVAKEDRPAVARESVSRLLAQAFGKPMRNGNAGVTVPAHLKRYVKSRA